MKFIRRNLSIFGDETYGRTQLPIMPSLYTFCAKKLRKRTWYHTGVPFVPHVIFWFVYLVVLLAFKLTVVVSPSVIGKRGFRFPVRSPPIVPEVFPRYSSVPTSNTGVQYSEIVYGRFLPHSDQFFVPYAVEKALLNKLGNSEQHVSLPDTFYCSNTFYKSCDSSVGIALGYGLDGRGSGFRFPAEAGNFSSHHRVQNRSGAHPASYPMGMRSSFPGGKAAGT
jgi:hypothetical protein